jgi:tellurite resistance protein
MMTPNGIGIAMSATTTHEALLTIMLAMATVDGRRPDTELNMIADLARNLPVFSHLDADDVIEILNLATERFELASDVDILLAATCSILPDRMRETAYALAVEVAAADLLATQEELSLLETLRDTLGVDPLLAAAVEASARVRYRRDRPAD